MSVIQKYVGSGGDFASWYPAYQFLQTAAEGSYRFTQVSSFTDTWPAYPTTPSPVNLVQSSIVFDSELPHNGDVNGGYITNGLNPFAYLWQLAGTENNTVIEFNDLNFLGGYPDIVTQNLNINGGGPSIHFNRCIFYSINVLPDIAGAQNYYFSSCIFLGTASLLISFSNSYSSEGERIIENCSFFDMSLGINSVYSGQDVNFKIRNCAFVSCDRAWLHDAATTATMVACVEANSTFYNPTDIERVIPLNSFKSLDINATTDFLKPTLNTLIRNNGLPPLITTSDIANEEVVSFLAPIGAKKPDPSPELHHDALTKLLPLTNVSGDMDNDITIEGEKLDNAFYGQVKQLFNTFPDGDTSGSDMWNSWAALTGATTTDGILDKLYGITHNFGRLTPAYLVQLGLDYGKTGCAISEADMSDFFLAGTISSLPPGTQLTGVCREVTELFEYTYTYTGPQDTAFEAYIASSSPAFTKVTFILI
jgi:hypothetical protein